MRKDSFRYMILFLLVTTLTNIHAQSKKQLELEERRQELRREISQINNLLFAERKEQKSVLTIVEDLNYKINVRRNLINITNQQANLLTREINTNQDEITKLRQKLSFLKEEYAAMIVKSYKSKSEQSKVMFLLSSSNFQQAYKRLKYIKQYADYQKKQAEEIKIQTIKLQELNSNLLKQKEDKQQLIAENRKAKDALEKELKEQETLIASIKNNMNSYASQIKEKQREASRIDREIEKIIREAIASSNKKAGKSAEVKTFALTPEEASLASDFVSNKGKLPWPVEEGVVKLRYGRQRHPVVTSTMIESNGVRIATKEGAQIRAVFKGEVMAISTTKYGNISVMIKHGNYITVYKNLSKIYVKKGQRVETKQYIGEVLTNTATGESRLDFAVFKETNKQDPAHWLYKM